MFRACLWVLCIGVSSSAVFGQQGFYPDTLRKDRLTGVALTGAIGYTATMAGLYSTWYSQYEQSGFQTFDDQREWLQMDKVGHAWTAYHLGRLGQEALLWSGVRDQPAVWYGAASSWVFLSTIEIFDGFSAKWGFSWTDIAANTLGSALLVGQELAWNEQRLMLKFSYHPTMYPDYRPDALGEVWYEQILKDYNGQTYWLSANVHSFTRTKWMPKWLNVSFGYSGEGMLGGEGNTTAEGDPLPSFERYRQYYLSLDVDLTRIKTKSSLLRAVFIALNGFKIPAPALQFDSRGRVFVHGLYF